MKQEKSCGALIFNTEKKLLLVQHAAGHWSFPKGHVEENETEQETAAREVMEEVGLEITFKEGFRESISYSPKKGVMKEVIFFLADLDTSKEQRVTIDNREIVNHEWKSLDDAREMLTHQTDTSLVEKAQQFLAM